MTRISVVTNVFVAKPEAIELLEEALDVTADRRKPAEVYLFTPHGSVLTIDVPHYGEELPVTLELEADVPRDELIRQADELGKTLHDRLGWETQVLGEEVP